MTETTWGGIPGLTSFLDELSQPHIGVLLVGSRKEATASPGSNVNLLVLARAGSGYRFPERLRAHTLVRPMTVATNYILPASPDRPEISVDLPREEALTRLAEVFAPAERIAEPGTGELELPVLDLLELRLLSRLAYGQVLEGADVVAEWRARLRTVLLADYYIISTFQVAEHYRRRASGALESRDRLSSLFLSQTAAEHLAYCALAMRGTIVYETKKLGFHIRRPAGTSQEPPPDALSEMEEFLSAGPARRLSMLDRWRGDLIRRLRAAPGPAAAFLGDE